MSVYRPVTHILPMATLRRQRMLPWPGRVVAREGQTVQPGDEVAYTVADPRYRLIDVAQALNVSRERADELVVVKPGDRVQAGDVLAERKGWRRRMVTAPEEGEVMLVGDGQVLLRARSKRLSLKAGFPGRVTRVYEDQGVEITVRGAVIDGVWGNGRVEYGLLQVVADTPGEILAPDKLSVDLRGMVVVGGSCDEAKVLELANELPLRALILGSLRARLIPVALQMDVPVVVLEGFGHIPINAAAFRLLKTNVRREVAVVADRLDREEGLRPQIIIPLDIPDAPEPLPVDELRVGHKVRIVRMPYVGGVGTVIALSRGQTMLPNGVRTSTAEVRLDDGTRVVVPLNNLEILA